MSTKERFVTETGLNADNFTIINVLDPVNAQDAATKNWTSNQISTATSGAMTGTAANVTGTVAIANGGTGATTASAALTALGGVTSAQAASAAPVQSVAGRTGAVTLAQADISGLTSSSSPTFSAVTATTFTGALAGNAATATTATTAGNVTGTVAIGNGGTGQTTAAAALTALGGVASSLLGAASGVATLDSGGHIPTSQLPASVTGGMSYQGTWNASTNSPSLASGTGTKGYLYKVSVAGTTTVDGNSQWNVGDMIVFDGTTWDKIDGVSSEVVSVAGRVGAVVLAQSDISGLTTSSSPTFAGMTATGQITSTVTTGTAPFVVASTTAVANLSIGGNAANVTGTVAIGNGGTGATTAAGARTALSAAALGANTDITSLQNGVTIPGMIESVSPSITATGTTQGTGVALTSDINIVTGATAGTQLACVTQAPVAGKTIIFINRTSVTLSLFPSSGAAFDGLGANAAISVPPNTWLEMEGASATLWYTTLQAMVNASSIQGAVAIANGGTGATTAAAALTALGAASTGANVFTATQQLQGSATTPAAYFTNASEAVNLVAAAPTATQAIYANPAAVTVFTTAAANNFIFNLGWSSSTTLNTALPVPTGTVAWSQSFAIKVLQGTTAYYCTAIQIDGTTQTVNWQGGTVPSAGNVSGYDLYTINVIKTAASTYQVSASLSQF